MASRRLGDEDRLAQLPLSLRQQLEFERFYLHNVCDYQNPTLDPEFDTRYFPQHCDAFELPCFWVKRKHLYVFGKQLTPYSELPLFEGDSYEDRVLFPVHPTSIEYYSSFLSEVGACDARTGKLKILAVPTSSTRTLLVWPDEKPEQSLFVKTSLHSPIFGDRHIYLRTLGRSIGSSLLMDSMGAKLPERLGYFPERVGFVPRSLTGGGVIVRSIPPEVKEGGLILIPLFALIATPSDRRPLLGTLLERSGLRADDFVENVLCRPFAHLWVEMTMCHGVMLEAHAQDLMLALPPALDRVIRFYYRDFEGVQIDWELRRRRGLPAPEKLPQQCSWYETYETIGYRQTQLAWYKLYISLFDFVDFVLHELDLSLRRWQAEGLIAGPKLSENFATQTFSRVMRKALEQRFGTGCDDDYDIHRFPKRFAIFLMKLRRDLLSSRI